MQLIIYILLGLLTGAILLWSGTDEIKHGAKIKRLQLILSMIFFPLIWIEALILGLMFIGYERNKNERRKKDNSAN